MGNTTKTYTGYIKFIKEYKPLKLNIDTHYWIKPINTKWSVGNVSTVYGIWEGKSSNITQPTNHITNINQRLMRHLYDGGYIIPIRLFSDTPTYNTNHNTGKAIDIHIPNKNRTSPWIPDIKQPTTYQTWCQSE